MSKYTLFTPSHPESKKVSENSKKAYQLLSRAGVPFTMLTASDVEEPRLLHRYVEYVGLEQIKRFVNEWQRNQSSEHCDGNCGITVGD